jgi:hypothetical protein
MSAFLCSEDHIGVLANAMSRAGILLNGRKLCPKEMALELAIANWDSVTERYPDDPYYSPELWDEYKKGCQAEACKPDLNLKPIAFIKMAQCFAYQACEIEKFRKADYMSVTIGQCHINSFISSMIRKIEGYEEAQWEYMRPQADSEVIDVFAAYA